MIIKIINKYNIINFFNKINNYDLSNKQIEKLKLLFKDNVYLNLEQMRLKIDL